MVNAETKDLKDRLNKADTYQEWFATATEIDRLNGSLAWKDTIPKEGMYELFSRHSKQIESLIERKSWLELVTFVQESLFKTVGELNSHRLYSDTLSGPKTVINEYLSAIEHALDTLTRTKIKGLSKKAKLDLFVHAERNFGRPALMLSGGGTFGIYHMGVIQALLNADILPEVISGTSMGSIAAGILAINNNDALLELYKEPENRHFNPLKMLPLSKVFSERSLLSDEQLNECVQSNIGDLTFSEAYAKTGREISITVSPVRLGQKPRVLNYLTAPNVLIRSASKASCSVPGLFPPCTLKAKNERGEVVDYLPSERWVDGSFASDIPQQRIGRLHNVNYFIVSQANPHILPFVSHRQKTGVRALIKDVAVSSLVNQGKTLLKVAQRRLHKEPWRSWLDHGSLVLGQDYLGDINLHPNFPIKWYLKFMKNPSVDEIYYLIKAGERATWPYITMIHNQTRISKKLRGCIDQLQSG